MLLSVNEQKRLIRTHVEEPIIEIVTGSHWCGTGLHNAVALYRRVIHHRYKGFLVEVCVSLNNFLCLSLHYALYTPVIHDHSIHSTIVRITSTHQLCQRLHHKHHFAVASAMSES